jgi:hypothetical protein
MQMLDGFNQGWIEFESGEAGSRKGLIALESVLRSLVRQQSEYDRSAIIDIQEPKGGEEQCLVYSSQVLPTGSAAWRHNS